MASVLTPPKPQPRPPVSGPPSPPPDGGWGGDDGRGDDGARAIHRYKTGMWLFLAGVTMVFAGFVSAYVVRRGASNDWRPVSKPALLWLNTAVLLASSLTMERARRRRSTPWLGATALLGALFLAGQLVVWQQLRAAGVYLASNPSSSFFYVLTGAHGLHLLGGVLAMFYVALRASAPAAWPGRARTATPAPSRAQAATPAPWPGPDPAREAVRAAAPAAWPGRAAAVETVSLYWHFMDGLWIFVFLLVFIWR